jgi:hypothetical protein
LPFARSQILREQEPRNRLPERDASDLQRLPLPRWIATSVRATRLACLLSLPRPPVARPETNRAPAAPIVESPTPTTTGRTVAVALDPSAARARSTIRSLRPTFAPRGLPTMIESDALRLRSSV